MTFPAARNAKSILFFSSLIVFLALLYIPVRIYNIELFRLLNCNPSNIAGGYFMLLMTTLVDGFFVLMISALLYPFYQYRYARFLIIFFITTGIIHALKSYFDLPRPLSVFGHGNLCRWGMALHSKTFPSGHSMAAASLLLFLSQNASGRFRVFSAIFCITGAFSRVYIGAHFPEDIWLGFWIAILLIFPVLFILPVKPISHRKTHLHHLRHAGVSLWGWLLTILYIFIYNEKTTEWETLLTPLVGVFSVIFLLRALFHLWQYRIDATS